MPPQRPRPSLQPSDPTLTVDPGWLLKALLATFGVALACAYIVMCILFHYQQWQLVLQPSRTVNTNPSSLGLQYEEVHISPDASNKPQIDGWWIPGDTPGEPTALLLHGGSGSMSDALESAQALHDARLNVLLFDYRGFGRSAGQHPSEQTMEADSDAALAWLESVRHVPAGQTLVFGDRLGASLAVRLCALHTEIAGLILQQGDGDFASRASQDTRARIVPFRLLFHEDFPLADRLHTLKTPKLLISFTSDSYPVDVQRAADPKMTYEVGAAPSASVVHAALRRFMDTYLAQPPSPLLPAR